MYTDKDYELAKKRLNTFILLYCLLVAALLAAIVVDQLPAMRLRWLTYVSASLLAVVSLFLWGTIGVRLTHWNRFLKEMQVGLERSVAGVIASIEEEESLKEGLEFRPLRLMTGEESDKAGGRLLYVDATRFPLAVGVGQRVVCRVYGNYVKDITLSEES